MKTITRTMFVLSILLGLAISAEAQIIVTDDGNGLVCQTLYAGQTIDAGSVCVEVVGDNLEVTYVTTGGWELVEAHLWVGDDLANMPQTRKGNPKPGLFPYASGDITGTTSYTFQVPLTNLGFSCPGEDTLYYVATHAALRKPDGNGGYQTETGWAEGDRFVEKGNWGTFFTITLTCNGGGTHEYECETAFAYGGSVASCFLDIDEDGDGVGDFNRWGWSNGPIGPGTYIWDIYAGAGQCDLSKGTLVGTLTVDYDGATAVVTYDMLSGFFMAETHLYVGNEILARDVNDEYTVAPGQYPYIHDELEYVTTDSYTVSVTGDIYVVAHGVVCQIVAQ